MIKTELGPGEAAQIAERIARWTVKWNLPAAATFLCEINRPIAPITGHALIGFGTMVDMVFPINARDLGLFLLEDANSLMLESKIKELASEQDKGQ